VGKKLGLREAQPDDPIYKLGWLGFSVRSAPNCRNPRPLRQTLRVGSQPSHPHLGTRRLRQRINPSVAAAGAGRGRLGRDDRAAVWVWLPGTEFLRETTLLRHDNRAAGWVVRPDTARCMRRCRAAGIPGARQQPTKGGATSHLL
jgi:hypothetical protein